MGAVVGGVGTGGTGGGVGTAGGGATGGTAEVGATGSEVVKIRRKPFFIPSKNPPPLWRRCVLREGILLFYNKIPPLLIVWTPVN